MGHAKKYAVIALVAAAVLFAYNKVPSVRRALGGV